MKLFALLIFLSAAPFLRANDKILVSLESLIKIPEKRHAALVLYAITNRDSSPAISEKRRAYYGALKRIAEEIKERYFWHNQFPVDVFAGIEDRAAVLVATQYPLSSTTGCSYVDMLRENYMNTMAEEIIVSMAEAICTASREKNIAIQDKPRTLDFSEWKKSWDSAGTVAGSPSPPAVANASIKTEPIKSGSP
jgi:hypothetical protein